MFLLTQLVKLSIIYWENIIDAIDADFTVWKLMRFMNWDTKTFAEGAFWLKVPQIISLKCLFHKFWPSKILCSPLIITTCFSTSQQHCKCKQVLNTHSLLRNAQREITKCLRLHEKRIKRELFVVSERSKARGNSFV